MNLEKFQIRTDLAFEALDLKKTTYAEEVINEEFEEDNLIIRRTVISENVGREIGKKPGLYYVLDTKAIKTHDHDELKKCENALTQIIKEVLRAENITEKSRGWWWGSGTSMSLPTPWAPSSLTMSSLQGTCSSSIRKKFPKASATFPPLPPE